MKLGISRLVFKIYSNTKFYSNQTSWSRFFHAEVLIDRWNGHKDKHEKLIVAFGSFTNARQKDSVHIPHTSQFPSTINTSTL